MSALPSRSDGVVFSPLEKQVLAYDRASETAHHLNVTAGTLLAACDGVSDFDVVVTDWAEATGVDRTVVAGDVTAGLDALGEAGLVGRTDAYEQPRLPSGCTTPAPDGSVRGAVHQVLDWAIRLRSTQPELLARIDDFLGTGADEAPGKPVVFDVAERADGEIRLVTDHEWLFADLDACLAQITWVMNDYAVATRSCAALHAGAVRSPTGQIVVVSGESGDGKSTLIGAFVVAGWDYLGDEAIGVRGGDSVAVGYPKRLGVDATGRAHLGLAASVWPDTDPAELRADVVRVAGDAGPVARVILPAYVPGAEMTVERLDPGPAADALLGHTFNLAGAGQVALDAICDLAVSVPVQRVTHGDVHAVVAHVAGLPGYS